MTPSKTLKAVIISSVPEKQRQYEVEETVRGTTEINNTEIGTVSIDSIQTVKNFTIVSSLTENIVTCESGDTDLIRMSLI